MLVRVRWRKPRTMQAPQFRNAALAIASLLMPSALIAFTVSFWSIAAELKWTSDFFVAAGLFSHWQVWLFAAGTLLALARLFNRYAERREP